MKINIKNLKRRFRRHASSFKNFKQVFLDKFKYLSLMHWTYPKKIFLGILVIWLVGALLLYTPIAFNYESFQYVNNEYIFKLKVTSIDTYMNAEGMQEYHYNFLKAIFTSASAFTDTGLTVIPSIGTYLSFFGQLVVFVLIEVGGFGYASLFYLIGKSLRKVFKKDLFSTTLLNIERGGTKVSNSSSMIIKIFFVLVVFQIIFSLILSGVFYAVPLYEQQSWSHYISQDNWLSISYQIGNKTVVISNTDSDFANKANNLLSLSFNSPTLMNTYHNYGNALWRAIFLTGSAINNAGFDLFGYTSLQFLKNTNGIGIQVLILILIVIGGIGFPILYDLSSQIEWIWKYKIMYCLMHKQEYARSIKPKFSVFSKLCLWSALIVSLVSIALLFLTEYVGSNSYVGFENDNSNIISNSQFLQNNISLINYPINATVSWVNGTANTVNFWDSNPSACKNFAIIFNCLACRSAGFSTISFQNMTEASILIIAILMFIGTSPSSTGGGIRTTTLFVMLKSTFSWYRGVEKTSMFKRKIPLKTVKESYIVFFSAIIFIILLTTIMFSTSGQTINGKNLIADEFQNSNKIFNFTSFLFEVCSAFGTSGNTMGISGSASVQWWNLFILMILMYIGQMGVSSANLLFARKVPKKQESFYLEEDIRIG